MTQDSIEIDSVEALLHMPLKSDTYLSPLFSPQTVKDARRGALGSVVSDSSQKNKNKIYTYWEIRGKIVINLKRTSLSINKN